MTPDEIAEVVAKLDAIDGRDGEGAHADADEILRSIVPAEICDAYNRVVERADFWAFA